MSTWPTSDDLSARIASDSTAVKSIPTGALDDALDVAIADVQAMCGREFTPASSATARVFSYDQINLETTSSLGLTAAPESSPLLSYLWVANIDDCSSITLVKTDDNDDGTYETTWTSGTDYYTLPLNGMVGGVSGWPTEQLVASGTKVWRTSGFRPVLQVTAVWGWASIPAPVRRVVLKYAAREVALEKAPFGVIGFNDWGPVRAKDDPIARAQLMPYAKLGGSLLPAFA